MVRKLKRHHEPVSPEIEQEKKNNSDRLKLERRSRREQLNKAALSVADTKDWKNLPISYKHDLILDWSINGGAVAGKRFRKPELAEALGLGLGDFNKRLANLERASLKSFANNANVKQQIFQMLCKLMNQLQYDRSRAVAHADLLEKELQIIQEKREKAEQLPESTAREREIKNRAIGRWINHFRVISFHKLESIRVLFSSTEAVTKFLSLFSGTKGGNPPGLSSLEDPSDPPAGSEYLNHTKAVKLLEAHQGQILPAQDFTKMEKGSRNPNAGFEEFTEPKPKD